jgi:hypothetical protein
MLLLGMSASDVIALKKAYALVCPRICQDTICQPCPPGPPGPPGPPDLSTNAVGSFYSDQTQNISSNSTSIWTLNASTFQRSTAITNSSRITVYQAGVYEVYYSAQLSRNQGGSPAYVYIWLKKNGVDVPETNGRVSINSNNSDSLPIVPYIIELAVGDYIEFAARTNEGNDSHITVLASSINASFGGPIPSIIVGIKRIG